MEVDKEEIKKFAEAIEFLLTADNLTDNQDKLLCEARDKLNEASE